MWLAIRHLFAGASKASIIEAICIAILLGLIPWLIKLVYNRKKESIEQNKEIARLKKELENRPTIKEFMVISEKINLTHESLSNIKYTLDKIDNRVYEMISKK